MKRILMKFLTLTGALILLSACATEEVQQVFEPDPRPVVAVMVTEGFHDGEAYMPIGYLTNIGVDVVVIGPSTGRVTAYNSSFTINIEKSLDEVSVDDFDGLLFPGGRAPAALREIPEAVQFAEDFFNTGKPVSAICHGPQVLARAGVLEGLTCTAVGGIREEMEEAGAIFVDEEVVVDNNLITSRTPPDLPVFSETFGRAVLESFGR